jgi:hypothetical protein
MSFEEVLRSHQGINTLARSLLGRPAFDELYVLLPDPTSSEPGFLRATSWLYCLYFEAGRVSLTFLRRLGEAYSLVDRDEADKHVETVRCLRTELHHNLGFADSDLAARTAAESWRRQACGTALPQTSVQWMACYDRIVDDAHAFLNGVDTVVRRIESGGDGARPNIDEWLRRLNRNWAGAAFDPLIDDAKYRLARESLNTVAFRNKHVDKWRKYLELLEDGFDFEFEATRLIEKTLLDEDSVVLPITGRDVIVALGVKPGPEVGVLLEEARRHFEVYRCTKDDLLAHLQNHYDGAPSRAGAAFLHT